MSLIALLIYKHSRIVFVGSTLGERAERISKPVTGYRRVPLQHVLGRLMVHMSAQSQAHMCSSLNALQATYTLSHQ